VHSLPTHGSLARTKTDADARQPRPRTRFVTSVVDDYDSVTEDRRRRIQQRASSLPRVDDGTISSGHRVTSRPAAHRRAQSVARAYSTAIDSSRPSYSRKNYGTTTAAIHTQDNDGFDIASFVLAPGEQFIPTNVSVSILPSGKQAITYTRFSQKGTGDQHKANAEIDRVIQRTNRLQVIFLNFSSSYC